MEKWNTPPPLYPYFPDSLFSLQSDVSSDEKRGGQGRVINYSRCWPAKVSSLEKKWFIPIYFSKTMQFIPELCPAFYGSVWIQIWPFWSFRIRACPLKEKVKRKQTKIITPTVNNGAPTPNCIHVILWQIELEQLHPFLNFSLIETYSTVRSDQIS